MSTRLAGSGPAVVVGLEPGMQGIRHIAETAASAARMVHRPSESVRRAPVGDRTGCCTVIGCFAMAVLGRRTIPGWVAWLTADCGVGGPELASG